nr:Holliday junction branch migration protein RuvA [Chlorobium phaeobacteroides]
GTKSVSRLSESSMRDDAVNALVTLGFLRSVAQKAVTESLTSLRNPQVEDLVRDALLTIRTP